MYDAMHDPARKDVLTIETDTGNGGFTHRYYRGARSVEEQVAQRDAIAEWARVSYGWIGRSPDYKAAFMATLGANSGFYQPFEENARRWYTAVQNEVSFVNHAIVNPPVDRDRPLDEVKDVYMHVERETDGGLIVSGAKVVATTSSLTHLNFIANNGVLPIRSKPFAFVCIVPTGTEGVKLLCRPSYEMMAEVVGTPFDYPLSSRMDENDSILIFDKVFVPWENVFAYGDLDKVNNFFPGLRVLPAGDAPRLHAPGGEDGLPVGPAAQGGRGHGRQGLPRRAGRGRRSAGVAEPVLGAQRRAGARRRSRGRPATCCPTPTPGWRSASWPASRIRRSRRSSRTRWRAR